MAVTMNLYAPGQQNIMTGDIPDLEAVGTTIKCALFDNNHSFAVGNENWGDVSTNEITSTDYTAGGEEILNKTTSITGSDIFFDTTDAKLTFTSEGNITAYHAVIYLYVDDDGSPHATDSKLIASIDLDGEQTSQDGEWSLTWHTDGIFKLTVNPV